MRTLVALARTLARSSKGATAVEYGFILALIVLALIASLAGLARSTTGIWTNVSDEVQAAS